MLLNHLFNLSGPRSLARNLTPSEELFRNVFRGFSEIFEAYERLQDFTVYLRGFPYNATRVREARHLRYTMENYLNEMYLLQQRLIAYSRQLRRHCNRRGHSGDFQKVFDRVEKAVNAILKPLVDTRGSNVHRMRFTNDDIGRLESLELLIFVGGMKKLKPWYNAERRRIRTNWRNIIRTNTRQIRKLLDFYFNELKPFIFGAQGLLPKKTQVPGGAIVGMRIVVVGTENFFLDDMLIRQ